MDFKSRNPSQTISDEAFLAAAEELDCDVAAVKAVAEVESRRKAYEDDGRPTILFERHKFRKYSNGRFNDSDPDISGPRGNYGKYSEQWPKLLRAYELDSEAALMSASWGQFQIMGFNHKLAGFDSVEEFVEAVVDSTEKQLGCFVSFVMSTGLDQHLRDLNWRRFALGYNGSAYRENRYDVKMAAAYDKFTTDPLHSGKPARGAGPDDLKVRTVRELQTALHYLGIDPGLIDNKMGPKTSGAIKKFQRFVKADETGVFSLEVRAGVQAAYHMMLHFERLDTED